MAKGPRKGKINGWERENPTDGEHYEQTQVFNELPEIGSRVVVMEAVLYERAKDSTHGRSETLKKVMVEDSAYFDAWNKPIVFEVIDYTRGRENPLDPDNRALLKRTTKSGLVQQISTTQLVCGAMQLFEVTDDYVYVNSQKHPHNGRR